MPSTHRAHAEWTPSRILSWAEKVGPKTRAFCEVILRERHLIDVNYSCMSATTIFAGRRQVHHVRGRWCNCRWVG
jgi:hypothetical protein